MGATYLYPPVSVTTLPPMGGATSANQVLEIAELASINTKLDTLIAAIDKEIVEDLYFDYSATNVDNTAWVELIAATSDEINHMTLFESGGYPLEIGIGAIGLEARLFLVPPGGFNGQIDITIPSGSRVSVRGLRAVTINNGFILANFSK